LILWCSSKKKRLESEHLNEDVRWDDGFKLWWGTILEMAEIKGRALALMDMVFYSNETPSSPTSTLGVHIIDEIQWHEEVVPRSKEDWSTTTHPRTTSPTW
jgi:hypothetical protein